MPGDAHAEGTDRKEGEFVSNGLWSPEKIRLPDEPYLPDEPHLPSEPYLPDEPHPLSEARRATHPSPVEEACLSDKDMPTSLNHTHVSPDETRPNEKPYPNESIPSESITDTLNHMCSKRTGQYFAGIDVGGTSIKSIVVDEKGTIVDKMIRKNIAEQPLDHIRHIATTLIKYHPSIAGIGILTPGIVDAQSGIVRYASNLALNNAPLVAEIEKVGGKPVRLEHDGRGAGLAESLFGAARLYSSSVIIPIGTGISAAFCMPGKVWEGETFQAGEIGHIPVYPGGEPCSCGQRGCLEVYASAQGISKRYQQRTGKNASARYIEEHVECDPWAQVVWEEAVEALSLILTHLTLTLDPGAFVIGGGLSGAGATLLRPLKTALAQKLAWRQAPDILTSHLGGMGGCWGAAVLACRAAQSHIYEEWQP